MPSISLSSYHFFSVDGIFTLSTSGIFPPGARRSHVDGRERNSASFIFRCEAGRYGPLGWGQCLGAPGHRSLHRDPNCLRRRLRCLAVSSHFAFNELTTTISHCAFNYRTDCLLCMLCDVERIQNLKAKYSSSSPKRPKPIKIKENTLTT